MKNLGIRGLIFVAMFLLGSKCFALVEDRPKIIPPGYPLFNQARTQSELLRLYQLEAIKLLQKASVYAYDHRDYSYGTYKAAAAALSSKNIIDSEICSVRTNFVEAHVDHPTGWEAAMIRLKGEDPRATKYAKISVCPYFWVVNKYRDYNINHDKRIGTLIHESFHLIGNSDECLADSFANRVMFVSRAVALTDEVPNPGYDCKSGWRPNDKDRTIVNEYYYGR